MFVSNPSFIKNIEVLTKNEICSSDHYAINFELTSRAKSKLIKRKIFDFKRANWDQLNRDLNLVHWDYFIDCRDPNEGWLYFRKILFLLVEKHIPMITIKDRRRPPWFDSETFNLCKKKERLHKKYKAYETPANYARFAKCRKKLIHMIEEKWKQT